MEYRQISLPVTNNSHSVRNDFSEATAPGLNGQPGFVHSALALDTDQSWRSEARSPTESLTPAPNAPPVPLAKHDIIFRVENRAAYDWYTDTNTGHYSFGQFSFMGDESVHFGAVLLKYLDSKSDPGAFRFFRFICGGAGHKETVEKQGADGKPVKFTEASFKKDDVCDLGQLDVKTRFVFSQTAAGNVVPFYYQPTLGGSDIESRVTLRGYPDYRFRGNDLALVQIEYSKPLPVVDPVGAFAFYDGGSVAPAGQGLGMARYRQDGGLGASLRLQGKIVLRAWAAMGGGHGVHIGYNLEKLF